MSRPPKPRPDGWGKDFILWWVGLCRPESLIVYLGQLATEHNLHEKTLYLEVCDWKKTDPDFAQELAVMEAIRSRPIRRDMTDPDWREKWGAAFLESRSKEKASKAIGTTWSNLWSMQHTGHANHDERFAAVVTESTQILLARMEEKLDKGIEMAEAAGDAKTLISGAVTVLERLDKRVWSRSEERTGNVNHQHNHQHNHVHQLSAAMQRAFSQAVATSAKLSFALAPQQALPASTNADAITVEVLPPEPTTLPVLRRRLEESIGTEATAAVEAACHRAVDEALPIVRRALEDKGPAN